MSNVDLPTTAGAEQATIDDHQLNDDDLFCVESLSGLPALQPTANFMASPGPSDDLWTYDKPLFGATGYSEANFDGTLSSPGAAQNPVSSNLGYESSSTMNIYYSSESAGTIPLHELDFTSGSLPSAVMPPDFFSDDRAFNNMGAPFEHFDGREHEAENDKPALTPSTKQSQSHAKDAFGLQTPSSMKSPPSTRSPDEEFYQLTTIWLDKKTGNNVKGTFCFFNEKVPAARQYVKEQLKEWRKSKVEPPSYLKPVPKQKGQGERVCAAAMCINKVKLTGNNDGIHCTRCFNNINNDKKSKYGMRLTLAERGIQVERDSHEPTSYSKKNVEPQPTATNIDDGTHTFTGASGLVPTGQGYSGNSHQAAVGDSNARYRNAMLPQSVEFEGSYGPQADAGAQTDGFSLPTSVRFKTEQEARNHLANPPREACQRIDFQDDDWQQVKYELFDGLVVELISVLPIPGSTPAGMDEEQRSAYETKHAKRLEMVLGCLRNPAELVKVEARARLLMDEVVRIHKNGIPQSAYARLGQTSNRGSGYKPELDLICSARARRLIELASQSKYIAIDVCQGNNLEEMALAPEKYFAKKVANSNSNGRREGKDDAPKKAKGKKVKKETNGSTSINPFIVDGSSNFDNAYASSNGYQFDNATFSANRHPSYPGPNAAWNMYMDVPVSQPSYNMFSDPVPATAGAGGKRKHPYGIDDKSDMLDPKRSKFGNEGGYGEGFELN